MNRINGLLTGAVFTALIAGCSSPKDPFLNRMERPEEQCLSGIVDQGDPQQAFGERQVMRYVVKKGDTLWDISRRFLVLPWYWKSLWYDNPQIRNPHLIYPGDVLSVVTLNGEKRITITEAASGYHGTNTGRYTKDGRAIYKYQPGMRTYSLDDGPITFTNKQIAPFLLHAEVFQPEQIKGLPKIFGDAGDYLTLTQQQEVYTQTLPQGVDNYYVYRVGKQLIDYTWEKNRSHAQRFDKTPVLGYMMDYVGQVQVSGEDIPSGLTKLQPLEVAQAMQEGDVLVPVPVNAHEEMDYFPRLPSPQCNRGFMLTNANTQTLSVKEFDTVVTSFGQDNNAQVGDIWKIQRPGPVRKIDGKVVHIPGKDLGYLMIIKVYPTYSLGFVLDSSQNIDLTDWLVRP